MYERRRLCRRKVPAIATCVVAAATVEAALRAKVAIAKSHSLRAFDRANTAFCSTRDHLRHELLSLAA
jgi:hypothetical protein